ncbi:polymorphic toxin-type HINT domain-containing protein [uncultured Chryseobacterium sp.]|uniref:polymorphic toxin-type HINT domain-containing protein n=1 Tax=uncultured Chryseobacterium sp. TaxID=259322 RepID=UPI0025FB3699|nr:polymorphic toxin-type HINT domain-containing protein [uncultured Chryseobacterium sp.]
MEEQYLTEKHYLVCSKGTAPKQMKVTSQKTTYMSGHLAATEKDTLKDNNFLCLGNVAFIAGAAAGICCCIPGPGWLVAVLIAAVIIAAVAVGYIKCKSAATQRIWTKQSPVLEIHGKKALTLSSIMMCPVEGGTITPKETVWEAWGSAALTNLGHVANFAFGFLAGRGLGAMTMGATSAAGGVSTLATRQGAATFGREFGRQFANTARKELVEQFTFKGFMKAPTFCKIMRGLGIGGAYYEQYSIWSSDQDTLDKLKESSVALILSVFAAKGASLVCFPAGTKVHTQNGVAPIEDLFEGDLVLTYNEQTKSREFKPILKKHERYTLQMLTIELPTGEFVRVTPEHRFFCNDEWIEAKDLQPGDLLHLKGGDYTTVISVETLPHYEKVYNFDIEANENYYVTEDGILVHNGYKPEAGTPEHKAQRWEDYQARGGELNYDDWSKRYDVAIQNANKGNAAADAYHESVGWGKREVTVEVELDGATVNRRLDIADVKKQKGIEVKSGNYFSRTEEIMYEIKRDEQLVKDGWKIEWRIEGNASQPLLDELKAAGISVSHVKP